MKRFKFIMMSPVICAAVICIFASGSRADDQQEISNLERQAAAPIRTPDQAMKFCRMFDTGDDVVFFDLMGPSREFVGQKAICDHAVKDYVAEFSTYKDTKVDVLELKVIGDGELALARSVQHATAKGPDGKPIDLTFRVTDVWRKINGQWKMILSHASFPIDMKTGKADMASKM